MQSFYYPSHIQNFPSAVVPHELYWILCDQDDEPSWYDVYVHKGCALLPQPVVGGVGFIFHFHDDLTPRPFSDVFDLRVDVMVPQIKSYGLFQVSPTHTGLYFRVHDDVQEIKAVDDDLHIARVSWSF
jgi:hypothetical protein